MPFIVLEGLDGAGKSTQIRKLTDLLTAKKVRFEYQHFPRYDSPVYGDLISRFLRGEFGGVDEVDPYLVALIFAGDRAAAGTMINKWLNDGKFVLTDRFVYSNVAFQCAKFDNSDERDKLRDWILDLEFGYNKLPRPDLSLFLDVPFYFTKDMLVEQRKGDDREYLRGEKDIHEESLELQRRVREMYYSCAERDDRLKIVDCSDGNGKIDTPENNFKKITSLLAPFI